VDAPSVYLLPEITAELLSFVNGLKSSLAALQDMQVRTIDCNRNKM
jgi:hypothetical protein